MPLDGLDQIDPMEGGQRTPYVPVPATPAPNAIPYSTTGAGLLTAQGGGATGATLTLLDGTGTQVYSGAGTATSADQPLDPMAPPGDPSSPGQVLYFTWDLSGLPALVYAGQIAYDFAGMGTVALDVAVTVSDGFPAPARVYSFADDLSGDLLNGCEPVRLYQGQTDACLEFVTGDGSSGMDATGGTQTLLAVPRRRRSLVYAFDDAVLVTVQSPATFRAFLPAGWALDAGPYWLRVHSEGGPGGVADTSPVLVMVLAAPAPTEP
jgi:hypothetical protein